MSDDTVLPRLALAIKYLRLKGETVTMNTESLNKLLMCAVVEIIELRDELARRDAA